MAVPKSATHDVSNSTSLWGQNAHLQHKKTLTESGYQFNPALVTSIMTRNPGNISRSLDRTQHFHDDATPRPSSLPHEQFVDLSNNPYFAGVLDHPVKLAIKLCHTENLETTHGNDPTRYDIVHCLAANWNTLVQDAEHKGHPIPDLKETLKYAASFEDTTSLYIFINGLSDENKALAAALLTKENDAKAEPPATGMTAPSA